MAWNKAKAFAADKWRQTVPKRTDFLSNVLGENPISKEGNPYAQYLSRSVLLEEASPPKNVRATINIIIGFLTIFIVWATITQLDERAVAPGVILPINFIQPVQHQEGGIIAQILVDNGDYVVPGQPLILLDDIAPRAQYESLLAREVALGLQMERLRAFALGREPNFANTPAGFSDFVADNEQIFTTQVAAREAQISIINAQIAELRDEVVGLREQEENLASEVALVQEEVNIRQQLIDRGLTSKITFLTAQRDLTRTRGQLFDARGKTGAAEAGIREAAGRILELEERLRNDAFTEMGAVGSERAQVSAQLAQLADRVERTSIIASTAGRIKGVIERPPGGIIAPAEVVMEIVPTEQELIAEIRISPRDIGHIEVGDAVLVKVETFNYARFGGIDGTVSHISAASTVDQDGNPFFHAEVSLTQNFVGLDPRSNHLTPGMTLVADIKTGAKSLIAYLLRPIYNTLTQSFGER
jgi:membrane fusion protein, adhesin transport system